MYDYIFNTLDRYTNKLDLLEKGFKFLVIASVLHGLNNIRKIEDLNFEIKKMRIEMESSKNKKEED